VEKGDLPEIARIDNQRFIASRTNSLIQARRGFEKASIKMSLFYRDADCNPAIATASQLPGRFPDSRQISREEMESGILQALQVRPEFAELIAAQAEVDVDLDYGRNLTLPKLNVIGYASQDIGTPASSTGDKTPFELQAGLLAELPLQRREGLGKIRSAEGKQVQINAKQRFLIQKVTAEIQDAVSAVNAAFEQIDQSSRNVELAGQSLELGRKLFDAGDIDIIELNIYETSAATAELQLLEAHLKYFENLAVYETSIRGCAF
jgi:outer membrane protein TolC